jgi:hypothetical protein
MPGYGQPPAAPPNNNLVWAILSTVFCCVPLGIPAIVYSAQVNTKWGQGDYAGAQASATKAKNFALWGTISGAVVAFLYIIFVVVIGVLNY